MRRDTERPAHGSLPTPAAYLLAVAAALAGFLAARYLFMPPRGVMAIGAPELLAFVLYLASCLLIIAFGTGMRSARRRIEASLEEAGDKQELRAKVEELETLVDILPARSEQRFREMADGAPMLIWMSGLDKGCTWFNRPWLEFVGRTLGQELGHGWAENVHRDDCDRSLRTRVLAFEARRPFTMEYRLRRHDGVYRSVLDHGVPLHAADGTFTGYIGSCVDIDDRKRAEQEARESEHRLAAGLGAMTRLHALSARLAACDDLRAGLDDILQNVIQATRADLGNIELYDPQSRALEIVAQHGFSPAHLDHFRTVAVGDGSAYERALASGERIVIEDVERDAPFAPHRGIAAAAGFRALQSTILKTRTGGVLGVLSTHFRDPGRPPDRDLRLVDLHARHAANLIERLRAKEALREADRRKDEFLATLAHELRNPLAPIRNAVELLRRGDEDASLRQYARGVIERQLAQLVRLIDDLLDSSRLTTGKLQLRKEPVELAAVVQSAVEASRPLLESRLQELTVTVAPEPILLEADPARLSQVVSNLLINAAKYTEKAGRVWLTAERQGDEAVVTVRDTGLGIEAAHLPRIFEMFSQAAPALERSQGGLGIGLSLVRGLVELHGGRVEAASAGAGRGSEFVVRLPVTGPAAQPPPPPDPAETAAGVRPCRILVVDDNQDTAESLAVMLRLMGHTVQTAHDGLEAVQAAAASRPDLLLLDIGLPRMNGYEAARRIREQPWGASVPIVALTGWGQEADRRRSMEAGFDHHLTKPVDAPALRGLLALVAAQQRHPPAA
jgi:PAS domain S-box-containing protein